MNTPAGRLAQGYKGIEQLSAEWFPDHQVSSNLVPVLTNCLGKLIDLSARDAALLVVGCGPNPLTIREFKERGFRTFGVEPIPDFVSLANQQLGGSIVEVGDAEHLAFEDESMDVVISESVLEHVESPINSLREAYRVLKHGGVAYFYTTNRFHFSLRGHNGEYNIPFFNWLPRVIKESYVFQHLHFDPKLANYSPRPAVHWFCYADLCELGRTAGFFKFYSLLDLVDPTDWKVAQSRWRTFCIKKLRSNVWLRGLALLQYGSSIFMFKR